MKKKLLGIVLASCALISMAQARFYVGVEGGYSVQYGHPSGLGDAANSFGFYAPATSLISEALKVAPHGFSVGAVFGTEDFYGKYFGTRWGISAGYTQIADRKDAEAKLGSVDAGLNFDLMLNFVNNGSFSFGVFGGVSADYHYVLNIDKNNPFSSAHLFDFSGRTGVTTMLADHHRIEFVAKLPIASMSATSSTKYELGGSIVPAKITFGASYKFVF